MAGIGLSHLKLLIILSLTSRITEVVATPTEVSAIAGEKATLQCQLNQDSCGPIHSIKWHRGFQRVYIFSQIGNISKAEHGLAGRATFQIKEDSGLAVLEVDPVVTTDEHLYTCEVTYLEAREHCTLLQYIRLNTFAKPETLRLEYVDGTEAANATVIGPFSEGTDITLMCSSKGGKPVAILNWFKDGIQIKDQYSNVDDQEKTGIASIQIQLKLGREELGSKLECQATSPVLTSPMVSWVKVDVNVRPSSWEITGYNSSVVEGSPLTLLCQVKGARPAANITWYNGTTLVAHQPTSNLVVEAFGTYETQSRLTFTVSRYDNGAVFGCQTSNLVLESMGGLPYLATKQIEVYYKPVVSLSPNAITVNETSDIYLKCEDDANPQERISVSWFQNTQLLNVNDPFHFEGGNLLNPNLLIKNATKYDLGNYTCSIQNLIGETKSEALANVNVLYRPTVLVTIEPHGPITEQDETNVTLSCELQSGNPEVLDAVNWYFGNELLDVPPVCSNTSESDLDSSQESCNPQPPIQLVLQAVHREFHGAYQCRARNEAGWGELSPPSALVVHYPPGMPTVEFEPLIPVKGRMLHLRCKVEYPGRPEITRFRWWRGDTLEQNQTSFNWTIFPVSVEHRTNFSCEAINLAGSSVMGSVLIDVFAPPKFITSLPEEYGVRWNSSELKLTCQVECHPACEIYWLKNGIPISFRDIQYTVRNTRLRSDIAKNQFESIISTLSWNVEQLLNGSLHGGFVNDNYTCQSSANEYGAPEISTTQLRVEYPPENITVSTSVLNVTENEYPETVTCLSNGSPKPTYVWKYGDEVVSDSNILSLNYSLKRIQGGDYECTAHNSYGEISAKVTINVHYAPECKIDIEDEENTRKLVCKAQANPSSVEFQWFFDESLFSNQNEVKTTALESVIELSLSRESVGNYRCDAKNSVGLYSCNFTIPGSWFPLAAAADNSLLLTYVLVAVAVILLMLIICVFICCVCRRKQGNKKNLNASEGKGDLLDDGKAYYENLPFHGLQAPESDEPYRPTTVDLDYADEDYRQLYVYGPVNYKAASILAAKEDPNSKG